MEALEPEAVVAAVPGAAPPVLHDGPGQVVTVDDESFLVRRRLHVEPPTYDYDWTTGLNPGYGFAISGPFERTLEDHAAAIREFLDQIDAETGYLA